MNVTTAPESMQEQPVTPLVENDYQQQIYRWVRKYLLLLSCRGDYTDWEADLSIGLSNDPLEVKLRHYSLIIWCDKYLSTKLPDCNFPSTKMVFAEAPLVSHEFRRNN